MMDESKTPPTHLGSCRYLTLYWFFLDLSIIQWPFSITKCQSLISRFATFPSQSSVAASVEASRRRSTGGAVATATPPDGAAQRAPADVDAQSMTSDSWELESVHSRCGLACVPLRLA
jgi:hypothetical protein